MNLQHYTDMNTTELILTNPDNSEVFANLNDVATNIQNQYIDLYHWAKGEIFDLNAIKLAVGDRNKCEMAVKELEKKKSDTQQDLIDVSQGKKTLSTLFKDKTDAGSMANKVENFDREIEAMKKLSDLLTIYLCERVLVMFKQEKLSLYNRILS